MSESLYTSLNRLSGECSCTWCCLGLEDSYPYDEESFDQTTEGEDFEDESIDRTAELENEVC